MNFSLRHSQRTWSSRSFFPNNSKSNSDFSDLFTDLIQPQGMGFSPRVWAWLIFYYHPKNNSEKRLWPGSARSEPNRAKNCSTSLFLNADPNGEDRSDWRFLYKKFCRFFDYKELKKVMENILEKAFINIILSNTALRG